MTLNYAPKTTSKQAADLKVGELVLESWQHPARIVRLQYGSGRVHIHCRYIWQASREPWWKLGDYHPADRLEIAKKGEC